MFLPKDLSVARLPLGARRAIAAAFVAVCPCVAAPVAAQLPDPAVLNNPHHRQTLKVDPSTWQSSAALAPEVRARVEAAIMEQRARKAARRPAAQKVATLLRTYQREASAESSAVARVQSLRRRLPFVGLEPDGTVHTRIHLRSASPADEAAVRALGVRVARVSPYCRSIFAALTPADIDRVAASPAVTRLAAIVGAQVNAGSVLSEGVAAHLVDKVQNKLNVTGAGVRIGVIGRHREHRRPRSDRRHPGEEWRAEGGAVPAQ